MRTRLGDLCYRIGSLWFVLGEWLVPFVSIPPEVEARIREGLVDELEKRQAERHQNGSMQP